MGKEMDAILVVVVVVVVRVIVYFSILHASNSLLLPLNLNVKKTKTTRKKDNFFFQKEFKLGKGNYLILKFF